MHGSVCHAFYKDGETADHGRKKENRPVPLRKDLRPNNYTGSQDGPNGSDGGAFSLDRRDLKRPA